MKRVLLLIGVVIAIAIPSVAFAQSTMTGNDSVLVAVDRDVVIAAGDTVGTLVVVNGNATMSGHARTVVVVSGTLTVNGTVEDTVVGVDTDVTLAASAVVDGDVVVTSGDLTRDPGATVSGSVRRDFDLRIGWALTLFSFLFWIGITVGLMVTGLVMVAIARRQIQGSGDLLTETPGPAILATVILVIAVPVAAIVAFITIIGIPVGLALLVVVLPLLFTAGYITASERVGRLVLSSGRASGDRPSPYLAVLLGVLIFQIGGLVPALGGLVIALAATYGAGGLALFAWRGWRGSAVPAQPTMSTPTAAAP